MKGTIAVLICTLYLVFALAIAEGQSDCFDMQSHTDILDCVDAKERSAETHQSSMYNIPIDHQSTSEVLITQHRHWSSIALVTSLSRCRSMECTLGIVDLFKELIANGF